MNLTINKDTALALIRLANNVASKDATRYHLQHVELKKLDNDYIELAATDGHIAVWVKLQDPKLCLELTKEPVYFSNEDADLLKAKIKISGPIARVNHDFKKDVKFPNMNQFRITDTKWTETIYTAKAPPELVIDRSFTIGFNIKFMARIEKAFAPSKSGCVKMTMDTRDKSRPFLIRSNNTEISEEAVVMPMRI